VNRFDPKEKIYNHSPSSNGNPSPLEDHSFDEEFKKLEQEILALKGILENERALRSDLQSEVKNLTIKAIEVQEEERKRISRNLHDGLGQNLYSHLITINLLQSQVCHPLIEQIEQEASQLIEEVREISWELRPSVLDDLGLIPAIRSFIGRYTNYSQIKVHFTYNLQQRFPIHIDLTVYRIIQEALTNIRKYAGVEEAWVSIMEYDQYVNVTIEDEGKGFDPTKHFKGVGLSSMEERARAVGGEFQLQSKPGLGTKIILDIPR